MSGTFTTRVTRSWTKLQPNISAAVFFWEWLNFFDSHLGFSFVGYGTDKVQSGLEPPSSWKNWDTAIDPIPMGDNSWFVVQADNSDAKLNNGGSHPWQVKFQITTSAGFDDCNVADTDYGFETNTYIVCVRANAIGGWNSTTLDFAPGTGEESSDNYRIFHDQNTDFYIDIIGDDDTIIYNGSSYGSGTAKARSRGGYIGMLQRRNSSISNPFFMKIGVLYDNTWTAGDRAGNAKNTGTANSEWKYYSDVDWPNYSLWHDGTKITAHKQDTWDEDVLGTLMYDPINGEDVVMSILVAQNATAKYSIIGEYRFLGACGKLYGQNVVFGTNNEWLQIAYDSTTHGGIAIRWPTGIIPIW